jgi:hypothetical protein
MRWRMPFFGGTTSVSSPNFREGQRPSLQWCDHRAAMMCRSYSSTRERRFFNSLRFRFDSKIRCLRAVGRGDLRRRSFSRAAIWARRAARCRSSIASSKRSRASLRFCACDRESWTVTLMPLGRWRRVTAVATLLTFWPPGPPERAKISSRSTSRTPSRAMRSLSEFMFHTRARCTVAKCCDPHRLAAASPPLPGQGEDRGEGRIQRLAIAFRPARCSCGRSAARAPSR